MTTELLICVMPEEWCGFQHSKYSSNYIQQAIAFKLYSTGQRLKFIYWHTGEVFEYQTKRKSLPLSFQVAVAVMYFVKDTSGLLSRVCSRVRPAALVFIPSLERRGCGCGCLPCFMLIAFSYWILPAELEPIQTCTELLPRRERVDTEPS